MSQAMSILTGFLLAIGAILGALVMRLVFHIGICG
jgi:hypothetical protein